MAREVREGFFREELESYLPWEIWARDILMQKGEEGIVIRAKVFKISALQDCVCVMEWSVEVDNIDIKEQNIENGAIANVGIFNRYLGMNQESFICLLGGKSLSIHVSLTIIPRIISEEGN